MTRKQKHHLLQQCRRNWAGYARHGHERGSMYTALYERDGRISTRAVENPMMADTDNLLAVCDGRLTWDEFVELLP